ncbi:MAG: DNA/RNA nuclease SfsA [Rhodospirillaceae bacterium]|jgi:sugar fermentation stimulation protein A|nr:DNA/RNA nuclease SfsA [Rhodospirillaceae bacterium]|tara:strand:- start:1685 stop:2395 length:711 start_codon:yes stop_codon:yes gene_type:complete
MKFPDPLIRGALVKRYKRFLADVELEDGRVVTAHCANPGSMLSVDEPGSEVWLSPARNPERKLKFTWEMIRVGRSLVGINTQLPNGLVAEAVEAGKIPELGGYPSLRREVKYGVNSRIDLLLENDGGDKCYVEVKNVTMKRDLSKNAPAEFPDAVTARGTKHLVELAAMAGLGHRAVMFYLVQRQDAKSLAIAADIDPIYAKGLQAARKAGVEVMCYGCKLSKSEIRIESPLPLAF